MSLWEEITFAMHELAEARYLSIPVWLSVGAALQLLALAILPARLSGAVPILYLVYCLIRTIISSRRIFAGTFNTVKRGRWTAELPKPDGESKTQGLVMFVLGARMNHPLGPLAPGNDDLAKAFEAMWHEADINREKWGFLGHTAALADTSDTEGHTMTWLSYWRNVEGLQGFATSAAHRLGEVNYNKNKYPNMGIMHETYHAPNGNWETIYDNMPPWGLGAAAEKMHTLQPKSSKLDHSSMLHRMRRNAANASL